MDLKFLIGLKIFFTWWNKQTFGTFLKTLFLENMLGQMNMEINIIKVKKMNVGLFIQKILRLQRLLLIGIYGSTTRLTKFQAIKTKNTFGKKNI